MSTGFTETAPTTLALSLAPSRARPTARAVFRALAVAAGALFVSLLAQVAIPLPFTPVPITGQTLGVLLVGAALGPGLGAASMGLYLVWGVVGLPVFAPESDGSHRTGLEVIALASATGGYLWGFVAASGVVGWLARRGWDRSLRGSIGAMLVGSIVIYAFGVPWLAASQGVPAATALEWGLYPFVVGDAIKLLLAAGLLPAAWRLLGRAGGRA